jgi:hypothetical protein
MGQRNTHDVAKISRKKTYESKHTDSRSTDNSRLYKYCNRIHPRQKELCPAYGKICRKCGKRNHFGAVCFSNAQQKHRSFGRQTRRTYGRDIRCATCESDTDDSDIQDLDFVDDSVKLLRIGKVEIHSR